MIKSLRYIRITALVVALMANPIRAEDQDKPANACATALANGEVCEAANRRALDIMRAGNLEAITVVQDVKTGSLIAFAASNPAKLDVTTRLLPLSTVKLMVAASWWGHEESTHLILPDSERLLTDSIVVGNDDAGRRIASALRESIGTEPVLKDLNRYGFPSLRSSSAARMDEKFWAKLAPQWKDRLTPAMSYHSLGSETTTKDWEDTLSIGEARFVVTALHLSRFLQAVGNRGIALPASGRVEKTKTDTTPPGSTTPATINPMRVMQESVALKLQAAMRGTVERGTAKSVAGILADTGWTIGGKTGTGPGSESPGLQSDGWFAGLIFDPQEARFTVATFVKHGGYGGGNAARISAELACFLSGVNLTVPTSAKSSAPSK
jgi:cell division protein FtsI/penicillin-binding protein 2